VKRSVIVLAAWMLAGIGLMVGAAVVAAQKAPWPIYCTKHPRTANRHCVPATTTTSTTVPPSTTTTSSSTTTTSTSTTTTTQPTTTTTTIPIVTGCQITDGVWVYWEGACSSAAGWLQSFHDDNNGSAPDWRIAYGIFYPCDPGDVHVDTVGLVVPNYCPYDPISTGIPEE
jgi:hypothetical protein